jgi:putative ubiquitin-RnfH superfamily antitoxin RatB of RatAB toxin-antitoxin module
MADAPAATIEVELVYALAREQWAQTLRVPPGTTVGEAIERSGILARHPEIATRALKIGIFGRRVAGAAVLSEFDRIEIYRPLMADPKQARRARARRTGNSNR